MREVVVLCYHAISERWPADLATTPERLERQVRLLLRQGYRATSFHDAVTGDDPGRRMAVTFDDGYRSVSEVAFPILAKLSVPATVFVCTRFAGRDAPMSWPGIDQWLAGPHEAELRPMSWEELERLAAAGWEIGSHTHSHPRLTSLADEALAEELTRSREICAERLGGPCRSLAYPYGDHDERVVEAAGSAGYVAAATLSARIRRSSPLRWPRIGVYHGDHMARFRAKVSPSVRRLRASRVWDVVAPRGRDEAAADV